MCPWKEQVGLHKLFGMTSGRFRHAQIRWHIVEKEGFVFGVKLEDYSHWVNGGRMAAKLFADHKNLLALFDDKVRLVTCTRPSRDKMTRWGFNLMRRVEQAGGCYKLFDRFITILGGVKKIQKCKWSLRTNFMQCSSRACSYFHHIFQILNSRDLNPHWTDCDDVGTKKMRFFVQK